MSLINKMLQDLDARKGGAGNDPPGKYVFEDLRPAGQQTTGSTRNRLWFLLTALILVGSTSAGYAYIYVYDGQLPWAKSQLVAKSGHAAAKDTSTQNKAPKSTQTSAITVEPLTDHTATGAKKAASAVKTPKKVANSSPARVKARKARARAKLKRRQHRTRTARATSERSHAKNRKRMRSTKVAAVAPGLVKSPITRAAAKTITFAGGIEKKIKPATPMQQAELQYRAALASMRQRQSALAEKQLRKALLLAPKHIEARELLVGVLIKTGRWPEAEKFLQQGMRLTPRHYRFVQLLARLAVEHGDDSKAVRLLESSVAYGRRDPNYIAFLATLYQRVGRHDKAIKAFGHALRFKPQEGRWWLGAGVSLEAQKQWGAARQAYQRAVASAGLSNNLVLYAQQRLVVLKNK